MRKQTERFDILRFTNEGRTSIKEAVAREFHLTVTLNGHELVTLLCSPTDMHYLAIGFLFSEGLLRSKDEIKKMIVDDRRGTVQLETESREGVAPGISPKQLITSSGGRGGFHRGAVDTVSEKVRSRTKISHDEVFTLVDEFENYSQLYLTTHGVHSAALCDRKSVLVFGEDLGRHNAIDKVFGRCVLDGIPTSGRIIMTSGRITSDSVCKVVRGGIPVIISVTVPTNLAIRIADNLGITLVGVVRKGTMNVYTNNWRIVLGDEL